MSYLIKEGIYQPWGRVLELSDGIAQLKVTLDIGPRIIYCSLAGGINLMYEDVQDKITKGGRFFEENFAGEKWRIVGGHRLWKAPEDLYSYYPDIEKVYYTVKDNILTFVSPVESTTGILKSLKIELQGEGNFAVEHKFVNKNKTEIDVSLWALTVLRAGGVVYFLTNDKKTGYLPAQNLVFWPYTDPKDKRLKIFDNYITVAQDKNITQPFKIGAYLKKGIAAYAYEDNLFIKKFAVEGDLYSYPDMGSNFEVYTNNLIIECESLSKIFKIQPNSVARHIEEWKIMKSESSKILSILENQCV